jgi:hypothetical protein
MQNASIKIAAKLLVDALPLQATQKIESAAFESAPAEALERKNKNADPRPALSTQIL